MRNNFLTSLLYRDCSPIGLDIGHDSIKMLQLRRREERWEVAAGGIHLFGEEVRQSPGLRWRYVAQAIDTLLTMPGRPRFRGRRVVACLDHEQLLVKNARLPKMPPPELAEAIRWEASDRFPFDVNTGLMRHLIAGDVRQGGEVRQEVLIFAIGDQALRDSLRMLEQAGCQPVGLDSQPVALARAMEFFLPQDAPGGADSDVRALADLGGHSCQMVITRGGKIVFVKTVEIGSNDLTRAVVEKVGTTFEDTAALRLRLGSPAKDAPRRDDPLGGDSKVYRAVTAAMRPVVERLAREIALCLRYYSVTFRGNRPDCVTFVGGASHDHLLLHLLSEALGLKVKVGRPLAACQPDAITCQWGAGPEAGGPEWAIALGCCLKPVLKQQWTAGVQAVLSRGAPTPTAPVVRPVNEEVQAALAGERATDG